MTLMDHGMTPLKHWTAFSYRSGQDFKNFIIKTFSRLQLASVARIVIWLFAAMIISKFMPMYLPKKLENAPSHGLTQFCGFPSSNFSDNRGQRSLITWICDRNTSGIWQILFLYRRQTGKTTIPTCVFPNISSFTR